MYTSKTTLISRLLATILAVPLLTMLSICALADSASLNTTVSVSAGNSNKYFNYNFEAGKSYNITASWASIPVFTGSLTGWSLETVSDNTGSATGDLIVKTAKKASASGNGTSVKTYTGVFTPTQNMSVLTLYTQGLVTANSININVEPVSDADVLLDATISVDSSMEYISTYFDANFEVGKSYLITATWASAPAFTAANEGKTAWKIQAAQDSNVAGDDAIIFKTTASNQTAEQKYEGVFSCTSDKPVFNFFAQRLNGANQVHFKIRSLTSLDPVGSTINVNAGDTSKYFKYDFEAGKSYNIIASWDSIPVFTGSLTGWSLETISNNTGSATGNLIVKTAKKASTSGNGTSVQTYAGVFTPTQDASLLELYAQGLVTANSINIQIEPATDEEDVLLDAIISVDSAMEYISTYFDTNFEVGKSYSVTATWASAPAFTAANEGKTAWKIQAAQDSDVAGDDAIIFKTTAANQTAEQTYQGTFVCTSAKPVFNFFAQRIGGANQIHFKIKLNNTFVSDQVTYNKIMQASKLSGGTVMQGFDIFNDVVFQCYDSGNCATYDLTTGAIIAEFQLGSAYSTNHCGNANFGLEYPTGNTQFPALYVSGDLTTKACYVESVTTTSAELIQTIYFDIDPSYNGGQIIVDRERNCLIYMQRQNTSIRDLGNVFKMSEFRIPALSEGAEVHLTNTDILGEPYELSDYAPLYQGATIYQGRLLQTHGLAENSFGSKVGLMNFDIATHQFKRHIDVTSAVYQEPQGVTVYKDRLIMNFNSGSFYELKLNLNVPQSNYQMTIAPSLDALKSQISEAVDEYLSKGFTVSSVKLADDFILTGMTQNFTADVIIRTPYYNQTVTISGTIGN